MAQEWRPWLPAAAHDRLTLADDIAGVVSVWSEQWWSIGQLRLDRPPSADTQPAAGLSWRKVASGLAIGVQDRAFLTGLLGEPVPEAPCTPADEKLLDALRDAAVGDLRQRMLKILQLNPAEAFSPRTARDHEVVRPFSGTIVSAVGESVLGFSIAADAIVRLIKGDLPPLSVRPPLDRLVSAVEVQRLSLAVSVGRCPISVRDLRGLAPGDVLILETAVDQPLPIIIDGAATRVASGHLSRSDSGLALTLK